MKSSGPLTRRRLFRYALQGATLGILAMAVVMLVTAKPDGGLKDVEIRWGFLLFAPLLVFVAWLANAARLWMLARALGHPIEYMRAMGVTLSTEFAIAASPAGVGGPVVRIGFLRKSGVPVTTSASMLAADVAADVLFFIAIAVISLAALIVNPAWRSMMEGLHAAEMGIGILILLAVVVVAGVLLWSGNWVGWLQGVAKASPLGRRYRLAGRIRAVRWTLRRSYRRTMEVNRYLLRHRRNALLINLGLSAVQWLCRYSILPVILLMFGSTHNLFLLIFIQAVLFAVSMLLVLPGGGGGVEIMAPFVLQYYVPASLIGVVLLVWRLSTYHFYLLAGGATFFSMCGRLHLFEQGEQAAEENGDGVSG